MKKIENIYFEKKVFSKEMMFVTINAINILVIGLLNKNIIKMISDEINPKVYQILCVVIGLSGLHLMFNRDSFLPFLGDTIFPTETLRNKIPNGANTQVTIKVPRNSKIVYWASNPSDKILNVTRQIKNRFNFMLIPP